MYYLDSNKGFYCREIHGENIPGDAVEISDELYTHLITNQSGKRIVTGNDGLPMLADPAPASAETLAANERAWRDAQLQETDSMVSRHRDEIESDVGTTLTAKQYSALQSYRKDLRAWPEAQGFPSVTSRPSAPDWLNA